MPQRNLPTVLICTAVCFNLGLCFLYTRGLPISEIWVALSEVCILTTALILVVSRPSSLAEIVAPALFLACNFVALWTFRQDIDIKGFRDVLIIVVFFWFGLFYGSEGVVNRALTALIIIISAVGLYEWVFLDQFVSVFDVFGYYQSRGTIALEATAWNESGLFASGIRPQGRGLLPFLGDHRVSSVFLEPVSMGNFAVILAAWGLSHENSDSRRIAGYVTAAALFTIAADARFASAAMLLLTLVRVTGIWRSSLILAFLPLVTMAVLIALPLLDPHAAYSDSFYGRLLVTGWFLSSFEVGEWLGVIFRGPMFADAGYAYAIQTFGLVFVIVGWTAYCLIPMSSDMGRRMKFFGALYIVLLLCISGTSLFSIKTGAVLWFILGALSRRSELPVATHSADEPSVWLPPKLGPAVAGTPRSS